MTAVQFRAKMDYLLGIHRRACQQHPSILTGGSPYPLLGHGIVGQSLARVEVQRALQILGSMYPIETHIAIPEWPTVKVQGRYGSRGSKHCRCDFGIVEVASEALIAVVEVGDLSWEGKLEVYERLLPGVKVIWIPKNDVSDWRRFLLPRLL
jgi:hypothetical protein